MSSQVWIPEPWAISTMRLSMAAAVCQNVRCDIQKNTDTCKSFWGTKEKFNQAKYEAHINGFLNDLNGSIKQLSPTEKKIYELILKDAVALFEKNTAFKKLLPTITEAEHIENISASKEIQLQAMAALHDVLKFNAKASHLCDQKYAYLWA